MSKVPRDDIKAWFSCGVGAAIVRLKAMASSQYLACSPWRRLWTIFVRKSSLALGLFRGSQKGMLRVAIPAEGNHRGC